MKKIDYEYIMSQLGAYYEWIGEIDERLKKVEDKLK